MVKGKAKGHDALEGPLADKKYKSGILEVLKTTPVQAGDFDTKAILLLDVLQEKGRALEACSLLQNSLQGVHRKKISNWRAYVYTLLRGVDEEAYNTMKDSKESSGRRKRRPSVQEADESKSAAKKEFNKAAAEFVPGKLWPAPAAAAPPPARAEEAKKSLRKDAAEFVPTAAAVVTPVFQPPPVIVPAAAMTFGPPPTNHRHPNWTAGPAAEAKALKPDAQEFVPGVSAWAGAMSQSKSKAKSKNKNSKGGSPPAAPAPTAAAKAGPVTPGLLPGSPVALDADVAAGGAASATASAPLSPAPKVEDPAPKQVTKETKELSCLCRSAIGAPSGRRAAKTSKFAAFGEFAGVFTPGECAAMLSAAEQMGFAPAEQDRAGGSPCKLINEDAWLADQVWQRVSGVAPASFLGKKVAGVSRTLHVQHGALGDVLAQKPSKSLTVQLCLKNAGKEPSASVQAGDLLILEAGQGVPELQASWLGADVRLENSWWAAAQERLGLGSFQKKSVALLLITTAGAVSVLLPMLRRRRLGN
mmetsp:Transcript_14788/g.33497  ORF Transcript_14788/g.33497 Transcript_14788/m.33497 type:complete len:530 (-) Transcript_14788:19-1608(-)